MEYERRELKVAKAFAEQLGAAPPVAVVLGSGLGSAVDALTDVEASADYGSLGLPSVGVKGHGGRVTLGRLGAVRAAFFAGRTHAYEYAGEDIEPVVRAVRAMAVWGVREVILTASTGSLRAGLQTGTLVRLQDFIDLTGTSPLAGPHVPERGPRFVDMSQPFDAALGRRLDRAAEQLPGSYARGVYAFSRGPAFESPAQVRALALLGGDVVGMSTVPETIAARQMGLTVGGLSVVSNPGAGLVAGVLDHDEVLAAAGPIAQRVGRLLTAAYADSDQRDHIDV